jgi:hypothetical protein
MAGGAADLPKWQAEQISCQNLCQIGSSKSHAKEKYFCPNFFYLQLPIPYVG